MSFRTLKSLVWQFRVNERDELNLKHQSTCSTARPQVILHALRDSVLPRGGVGCHENPRECGKELCSGENRIKLRDRILGQQSV